MSPLSSGKLFRKHCELGHLFLRWFDIYGNSASHDGIIHAQTERRRNGYVLAVHPLASRPIGVRITAFVILKLDLVRSFVSQQINNNATYQCAA